MKKILSLILIIVLTLCLSSCKQVTTNPNDTIANKPDSTYIPLSQGEFISQEEKNSWKSKLTTVLSKLDINDPENSIYGSFAVGLMDINFDNVPEVLVAYAGGSMGNVFIEIYDLISGEETAVFDAAHYEGWDNIFLCVYEKDGERFILSEGSLRFPEFEWVKSVFVVTDIDIDNGLKYLKAEELLSEAVDDDIDFYSYKNQEVEKSEYEDHYQQFLKDYKKIEETQIQLIKWSQLESDSDDGIFEKMADALINSGQEFINNK